MHSNKELIDYLINVGVLKTPAIIEAFLKIDRADFIPDKFKQEAYKNHPISIGYGQTISKPYIIAFLLELLQPQRGDQILDIGSGSGYTDTVLAEIVGPTGKIDGLEIIPELVKYGRNNLRKYNLSQVSIKQAGKVNKDMQNKYDRILTSASTNSLPYNFIEKLKTGGILVIPIGQSICKIDKINEKEINKIEYPGFIFEPLK